MTDWAMVSGELYTGRDGYSVYNNRCYPGYAEFIHLQFGA